MKDLDLLVSKRLSPPLYSSTHAEIIQWGRFCLRCWAVLTPINSTSLPILIHPTRLKKSRDQKEVWNSQVSQTCWVWSHHTTVATVGPQPQQQTQRIWSTTWNMSWTASYSNIAQHFHHTFASLFKTGPTSQFRKRIIFLLTIYWLIKYRMHSLTTSTGFTAIFGCFRRWEVYSSLSLLNIYQRSGKDFGGEGMPQNVVSNSNMIKESIVSRISF